jgi:hypothetical protein
MRERKKKPESRSKPVATAVVVLVFLCLAGGIVYLVKTDSGTTGKKVFIAKVDLVKPNLPDKPPPPPKEQPQTPETQKKETIMTPQNLETQEARQMKGDDKPAAEGPLGVQGEGGPGSDAFGLVGRGKGGRDITTVGSGPGGGTIGGGTDQAALLRKFGRYNQLVQEQLSSAVRKWLQENGGIPKGKLETVVQIVLDDAGAVRKARITRSCGNQAVDEAVKQLCGSQKISEPLPKDIPRTMNVKITSQG